MTCYDMGMPSTQRVKDPRQLPVQLNVSLPWSFREFLHAQARKEKISLNKLAVDALREKYGAELRRPGSRKESSPDQRSWGHVVTTVNHNQRVLKSLRDDSYYAEVVERWDAFSRRRHDLFGFIDILAVGHGETKAIQVTSRDNMSSRRIKMQSSPVLAALIEAGWSVELWGYDKQANGRYRRKVEFVLPLPKGVPSVTSVNA